MTNNKQSSVEWFANESCQLKVQLDNQEISVDEYAVAYVILLYKAKAMHKEEIENAHYQGQSDEKDYWNIGDKCMTRFQGKCNEYYKETFEQ